MITYSDEKYLLRIASIDSYEERKKQYELLKEIEKLNVNAPKPISFGKLNEEKIYTVLTYLESLNYNKEIVINLVDDDTCKVLKRNIAIKYNGFVLKHLRFT